MTRGGVSTLFAEVGIFVQFMGGGRKALSASLAGSNNDVVLILTQICWQGQLNRASPLTSYFVRV